MTTRSDYMENGPLFTVATVTFNAEATLGRTLKSVAEQDYPRIEHLIIDGCSKDGTLALLQQYAEVQTSHTVRIVSEPDRGLYDAMNKALAMCTGDYIVFLNAGDKLHAPSTLSNLAACISRDAEGVKPAVVYGETNLVDDEGRFLRARRLQAPEVLSWRSFRQGMLVCHQSFYARTDVAKAELYDLDYRFSADYDWCIRVMKRAAQMQLPLLNSHEVLTDYLSEGLTTKNHRRSLFERLRLMAHHYGWPTALLMHAWFVVRAIVK